MRDLGPAVELIWWDPDTDRYRWTYRRADGVHRTGEAWTYEQAELRLDIARTALPRRPTCQPAALPLDRTRYRIDRRPQ